MPYWKSHQTWEGNIIWKWTGVVEILNKQGVDTLKYNQNIIVYISQEMNSLSQQILTSFKNSNNERFLGEGLQCSYSKCRRILNNRCYSWRSKLLCGEKIPTYIIVHSANTSYHCSSSSKTLCIHLPMLIDKQIGFLTYILGLVLRTESHMNPLHNL